MVVGEKQEARLSLWARWRRLALDLIFPPRCVGCGARGAWLCPNCQGTLRPFALDRCVCCGWAIVPHAGSRSPGSALCARCRGRRSALDGLYAGYQFEGALRAAIHRLKYRGGRYLADELGRLLADLAAGLPPADVVVPVPLHRARLAARGFNQSTLLAAALARQVGLPLVDGPLVRVQPTPPQVGLSAEERRRNVVGAFAVVGGASELAGRRVLLVDDVCTTGATLDACALALKEAGCSEVRGVVLARAR